MKVFYFLLSLLVTISLIVVLSTAFDKIPPFGTFLSPQHGFWQNAEPAGYDYSLDLSGENISAAGEVYFDNRMVPHIFAENEKEAYFIQGYLHAKFRLWQMEFQTFAAAGRLTEVLGTGPDSAYLNNDRKMRRMGMVYGAKRSLAKMEQDAETKSQLDAYTAGVNSYLAKMTVSDIPLEYRLLNYLPERWSNMKTALLLKYLSLDLTGGESDIEYTNARSFFTRSDFNKLYPLINDSSDPVIPKGTTFNSPSVSTPIPATADSVYYSFKPIDVVTLQVDKDKGSNNWAVAGSKTASGRPILCNDPHLGLNLPSLWYEVQITTPTFSVYGVSLPGAAGVVIGFNDSIAWGLTSAARDVLDFYNIEFRDAGNNQYKFNNEWVRTTKEVEIYRIKGGGNFSDTVAYTFFGPVLYDQNYNGRGKVGAGQNLAVRWTAHDPSNEFRTLHLLNKARNYSDYKEAISYFYCPGQNFAFASKSGDIALWHQGLYPAKWHRQGDFVLPGNDSSFLWQGNISQEENPHQLNPARGYVSSANQIPADTTYPYYLNMGYDVYRGVTINRMLDTMNDISTAHMQRMQNDNFNSFAESSLPFLLANIDTASLSDEERKFYFMLAEWNYRNDTDEYGPTIFTIWIDQLGQAMWDDEYSKISAPVIKPTTHTLIDQLKSDSVSRFTDDIRTSERESEKEIITASFKKSCTTLMYTQRDGKLNWSRFKDSGVRHLLRMEQLSRFHLSIGGGSNVINATKQFSGPSWKMIVHLTDEVEAYGIYPGGQTGNPGCKTYDEFVDDWAAGKYYRLWFMKRNETNDRRVKAVIRFSKQSL